MGGVTHVLKTLLIGLTPNASLLRLESLLDKFYYTRFIHWSWLNLPTDHLSVPSTLFVLSCFTMLRKDREKYCYLDFLLKRSITIEYAQWITLYYKLFLWKIKKQDRKYIVLKNKAFKKTTSPLAIYLYIFIYLVRFYCL